MLSISSNSVLLYTPYQEVARFYLILSLVFSAASFYCFYEPEAVILFIPALVLSILFLFCLMYFYISKKSTMYFSLNSECLTVYNSNRSLEIPHEKIKSITVGSTTTNPQEHLDSNEFSPTFGGVYRAYMNSPIIFSTEINSKDKNYIFRGFYKQFESNSITHFPFIYGKPNSNLKSNLFESLKSILHTKKSIIISTINEYSSLNSLTEHVEPSN